MKKRDFRKLVEGAVAAALATSTVTLVGCDDSIDLDGFEQAPCDNGISDLNPPVEVEYVSILKGFNEVRSTGTACATASEPQTCREALDAAELEYAPRRLLTTLEDMVERYETREEALGFLGSIDTPGEAVLLVWWDGYTIGCSDLEHGAVKAVGNGFEVIATKMVQDCWPVETRQYRLWVSQEGEIRILEDVQLAYDESVCIGRRPDGFEAVESGEDDICARYWSTTAHLEAAAVHAFENLAIELGQFGAPEDLIVRAREAAAEERQHTVATSSRAAEFGGVFVPPEASSVPKRTLLEFAIENAAEGCVRETFGAVVGSFQGCVARRASVAQTMQTIGREETGHAELSWDIADWLNTVLSPQEQADVARATRRAVAALMAEVRIPIPLALVAEAGLPTPDQSLAMFAHMKEGLWDRHHLDLS